MIPIALFLLAGLAAVAGVWPMALISVVMGLLIAGAQRVDDTVSAEAEGTPAETMSAAKLMLMWLVVGVIGAGLLFLAIGATLAALE